MTASGRRPELCVGAVCVRDEHLLLIRRATEPGRGLWSLPGGRVEPGEAMVQAVVRELEEETGLEGVCGELVGWVERISPEHHFAIFDFAVTLLDPMSAPRPGDDAEQAAFIPLYEVSDLPLVDGLIEFLSDHGVLDLVT